MSELLAPSSWPGRSWPLGSTWGPEATNFAVYAPAADQVWVCLFDEQDVETRHRLGEHTLGVWHGAVPGVEVGTRYGYRAAGPWQPETGLRFNEHKLLLDPYARAISGEPAIGPALYAHDLHDPNQPSVLDSAGAMPRGVICRDEFEWGADAPPRRRWRDTVVYEVHTKGFTQLDDRIPAEIRGTFAGLAHPAVIEYLSDLGVTAVELLPVHQFVSEPELVERGLVNYWGYNTIGFFAPHAGYSASGDRGQQIVEFKQMVKDLHAAGIEVILDVVFNHTAEAGPHGPTLSFRGLDDRGFYRRAGAAIGEMDDVYWDVTGCGNTVNTDDPHALRLILDSLRYWAGEMHVDGFRFDLLSALARTGQEVDMQCHLLTTIGQDPVLRHLKLIAEPWDTSMEGYRVGGCPPPWVEWNDQFRDTMRDFWLGRSDGIRNLATRLAGSSDLYADDGRSPFASVNFVTAHDGFTVRDVVSYDAKHNEANGHDNLDGADDNRSSNCGVEGETDDPAILATRHRLAANLLATLCLANGVPMLTAGDERGRTQGGNNNAFCQDNETSWVDWADQEWLDLTAITRAALRIRREHPALRQRHWFEGRPTVPGGPKDLAWIHPAGLEMTEDDWLDDHLLTIGMFVSGSPLRAPGVRGEVLHDSAFLLWLNGSSHECACRLPENDWVQSGSVVLSTDALLPEGTPVRAGDTITLAPQTLVLLQQATDPSAAP